MPTLLRKKEYKDINDNLTDVVFDFENDNGEIIHIGVGKENLLLTPEEQKNIVVERFYEMEQQEIVTEINEEL